MQESLYDRFRPFKPYDLALALVMVVLVATSTDATLMNQGLMVGFGILVFIVLDFVQRRVPVPTPLWQALAIVALNTVAVTVLVHLPHTEKFMLAFYMLNVAFATVAFGEQLGLAAAFLSAAALIQFDFLVGEQRSLAESALLLVVLITLVAMLVRVNRLQRDALVDVVTGLRNHRYFQVRLREEIQRSERSGRATSLVMLDLDNFKRINDRFGHATGDAVLRRVARELLVNARAADIVCRYGGEEFTIILPETDAADAALVAERLRQAVERLADQPGPVVTISVGVGCYPDHADDADALISAADAAMYQAKAAGKNRVLSAPVRVDAAAAAGHSGK
jgi:diguanylate cyclase (GGDEF)-like protein